MARAVPFWWCFCGDFTCPAPSPFISSLSVGKRFVLCFLLTCSGSFCGDAEAEAEMEAEAEDVLPDRAPIAGRPRGPLNEGVRAWTGDGRGRGSLPSPLK
jgi:hypothetical protein